MDRARPVVGAKSTPLRPRLRRGLRSVPLPLLSPQNLRILWGPHVFWRNQKEKMGGKRRSAACGGCSKPLSRMRHDWRPRQGPGIVPPRRCCNEPASILAAIPPPVRASTTFPLRGKSKLLLSEKNPPFPCGENPHPPRGSEKSPLTSAIPTEYNRHNQRGSPKEPARPARAPPLKQKKERNSHAGYQDHQNHHTKDKARR